MLIRMIKKIPMSFFRFFKYLENLQKMLDFWKKFRMEWDLFPFSYGNLKNSIQELNAKIIVRIVENLYAKKRTDCNKEKTSKRFNFHIHIYLYLHSLFKSIWNIQTEYASLLGYTEKNDLVGLNNNSDRKWTNQNFLVY